MAKADGAKTAIATALRAGGLRAALGLATSKAQKDTQTMLGAMVERMGHILPFLGAALASGKASKHAAQNLMEIAKTMEALMRQHQETRVAKLRSDEKLELKTPAPATPEQTARAKAVRPAPQNMPSLAPAPAPKPTWAADD